MPYMILPDDLSLEAVDMIRDRELAQIERVEKLLNIQHEQIGLLWYNKEIGLAAKQSWHEKFAAWQILLNQERRFCKEYFLTLYEYVSRGVLSDTWHKRSLYEKGK